jgi:hypothetical protein
MMDYYSFRRAARKSLAQDALDIGTTFSACAGGKMFQ